MTHGSLSSDKGIMMLLYVAVDSCFMLLFVDMCFFLSKCSEVFVGRRASHNRLTIDGVESMLWDLG